MRTSRDINLQKGSAHITNINPVTSLSVALTAAGRKPSSPLGIFRALSSFPNSTAAALSRCTVCQARRQLGRSWRRVQRREGGRCAVWLPCLPRRHPAPCQFAAASGLLLSSPSATGLAYGDNCCEHVVLRPFPAKPIGHPTPSRRGVQRHQAHTRT